MDRALLIASTFCFLLGFAFTMFALGRGHYHGSRLNFAVVLLGFLFQTGFLYGRGEELGRCPLTSLPDVLVFLSWSMVLIYLLVGTPYRLSLLGAFTAPLVFIFQVGALIAPAVALEKIKGPNPNPWLSMHAAISVVAYGAFALSCVAGLMYLAQDRLLKSHRIRPFFFELPPIADLAVVIHRLLLVGFVLLTIGLGAVAAGHRAAEAGRAGSLLRAAWPVGVWMIYAVILAVKQWRRPSPRRIAALSVAAFVLALSVLWGINFVSGGAHY